MIKRLEGRKRELVVREVETGGLGGRYGRKTGYGAGVGEGRGKGGVVVFEVRRRRGRGDEGVKGSGGCEVCLQVTLVGCGV